jgi:hypothetical protein
MQFSRAWSGILAAGALGAVQPCRLYYRPGFIAHRIPFLMIP